MILTIKHKFNIYRRFEQDIWGICYTDVRYEKNSLKEFYQGLKPLYEIKSPYLNFFYKLYYERRKNYEVNQRRYIYRLDIIPKKRVFKDFKKRFMSIRITRLYFLTFQDHQFRRLFKKASKMDGNLESNYCHMLECRLPSIVYRMNLLSSPFQIIRFVKSGNLFVNFFPVKHVNSTVPVGQFITINLEVKDYLKNKLLHRLSKKAVLFPTPGYLFISYKFFFCYILKYPTKKDLVYPIALDIQRITGYY